LADDTMEIHEIRAKNSGRDDIPTLINRQKVPKIIEPLPQPGEVAKRTVLNVFGNTIDGYYILDRLRVKMPYIFAQLWTLI
jgi:hypothetical protein